MKKYNSYKCEITPEVANLLNRDFYADQPNIKWLTDITKFAIPAGKVYLSPSEHPIVHTDRGSHYRWPGWIDRRTLRVQLIQCQRKAVLPTMQLVKDSSAD